MWNVRGRGGILFAVSDPALLSVRLEDDGDGFSWRAADASLSLWDHQIGFQAHFEGAWEPLEPLEVDRELGRVAFPKCLRGRSLQAVGQIRPLSTLAEVDEWLLHATPARPQEGVFGEIEPADLMLARLTFAGGYWVGVCKPCAALDTRLHVEFEEGAPRYVRTTPLP